MGGGTSAGTSGAGGGVVVNPPVVLDVSPGPGAGDVSPTSTVVITFDSSLAASTVLVGPTGACSGSVQLSCDAYASCLGVSGDLDASGTVLTLAPGMPLPTGATCSVRLTSQLQGANGAGVLPWQMSAGFTVAKGPSGCPDPAVVISQIYGGGGNAGAPFDHDFVELFNRGVQPVDLSGWSLQYASATGAFTQITPLAGVVAPGRYFLIQEASGGGSGAPLPSADLIAASNQSFNLSATHGKVALVNGVAPASSCAAASVADLVGYGPDASCSQGAPASAGANASAVLRHANGCVRTGDNATDFDAGPPVPRSASSAAESCLVCQ